MFPNAARYLALAARGRNHWWRYVVGVLMVTFFFQVMGYVPYRLFEEYTAFNPMLQFIALNLSVLVGLLGLAIVVVGIHRRSLLSLVTPYARFDWRRAMHGAAVWGGFAG